MIFFTAAGDLPKFPPVRFLTLNLTIPGGALLRTLPDQLVSIRLALGRSPTPEAG
jgi:hypothetical protein